MRIRLTFGRHSGRVGAAAVAAALWLLPRPSLAVPSFADQTGLPCARCHVIAFGPALTEYGRQFKLNGYTFKKQSGSINIPLAATMLTGFTDTSKPAPTPSPFADNDNVAVQTTSVFLAGGLSDHFGAFIKGSYDGIARNANWDNLDVRYARNLEIGGHALVAGLDINNNPGVQDLWNTNVAFGFPYTGSELAHYPSANPVLRGALSQTVLGASAYSMIDNLLYLELGLYRGISDKWLANLGEAGGSAHLSDAAPYARAAVHQQLGLNYFEVGAVGLSIKQTPYSTTSATDRYTDYGLDATYQFAVGGEHAIDAHLVWIHEDRHLDASFATQNSDAVSSSLDSVFGDVSYVIRQTWVGSVGLFDTNGTTNHLSYGSSASGSPLSRGYILQLECVPFGKADSFASPWVNLRLGLQYTGYLRFNGASSNYNGAGRSASDNNALFLFAWLAL